VVALAACGEIGGLRVARLVSEAAERKEPAERAWMHPSYGETLSILVVEDDVAVAELIRTVLNDVTGWGATIVHDASAAREVLRHVNIEVLVVDVNLPGISGLELLRHDPQWDEPPVLLMSGQPEQAGIAAALRDGLVTAFLAKPFDVEDLVAEVHKAVATPSGGAAKRQRRT
jgi:DNA-binding response OmpR family regulator